MKTNALSFLPFGLIVLLFVAVGFFLLESTAVEDSGLKVIAVNVSASEPVIAATGPRPALPLPDEPAAVNALESQIVNVYAHVSSAVVNISAVSFVNRMFGGPVPQEGTGSGFVYDPQGRIVTNYHVVEGAEELTVSLANGQTYEAELVGSDPINDLAVIQIDAGAGLPTPLPLHDSNDLRVGQFVLAIGAPLGWSRRSPQAWSAPWGA